MAASGSVVPDGTSPSTRAPDHLAAALDDSWNALFAWDRVTVERFQLAALRERFHQLLPHVSALRSRADANGITDIASLDAACPLLFDHSAYKSYPISLLERKRFGQLTQWLDGLTSVDLSHVNTSRCTSIDGWLDQLEAETDLRIYHTSGTSGKLSFIPRTELERDLWNTSLGKSFAGFGDDPGTRLGGDGERMHVVCPNAAKGRYTAQYIVHYLRNCVAPRPEDCHVLDGATSADLVSLSGRIRVAQAKGELGAMQLEKETRIALRQYLEAQRERPRVVREFLIRKARELEGKRVLLLSTASFLVPAAQEGLRQGITQAFSKDSLGHTGGGSKDVELPSGWERQIADFSGITDWRLSYAMSEQTAVMPRCHQRHYHVPPYCIPYLLDPQTGVVMPRSGRQTGRFAAFDIIVQTFWGGIVSGDRVTIEWDAQCPCGRRGPYILDDIVRYSAAVTGDDKVTCAATVDNSDPALTALLAV